MPYQKKDLKGKRFGMLEVISFSGIKDGRAWWLCNCDCGNTKMMAGSELSRGRCKSCGCLRAIENKSRAKHGMADTKIYSVYRSMMKRCYLKSSQQYNNYGGRGISVCDEWRFGFENFYDWVQTSGYQEGLSIDRINNNGDYCPENCRWATVQEQGNNRRTNVPVTIRGETHNMYEWAKMSGVSIQTIHYRLNRGLSEDELITPTKGVKINETGQCISASKETAQ